MQNRKKENRTAAAREDGFTSPGNSYFYAYLLQYPVVWADVFVMPVFHSESAGNDAKRYEADALVQMTGMDIG